MNISIYSLNCPLTNAPKYIGKTQKSLGIRLSAHKMIRVKNKKSIWVKSLKSKGLVPIIELIDSVPESEWIFWEQHYISLYRSWGFNLKNMTIGGESACYWKGKKFSEEHRMKMRMSRAKVPNSVWAGKKASEVTKKKMGDSRRGRTHSEESKHKIRIAHIGMKASADTKSKLSGANSHMFGKKLSLERLYKLNAGRLMYNKKLKNKEVENKSLRGFDHPSSKILLNTENGIFYSGMREAAESIGINKGTLSSRIRDNKRKKSLFIYA